MTERVLSVFCDESGDFGPYTPHCPYFMLSFVFHDQSVDIQSNISIMEHNVELRGFPRRHVIHTAPLIRREPPYENTDPNVRRQLFDVLFNFYRHSDVSAKSIIIKKREFGSGENLVNRIDKELGRFVRDNLAYFQAFDRVIVYYDKGQREVSHILRLIFRANLSGVEFRIVHPNDYKLFQVADLTCTLELLNEKRRSKTLSKSEVEFFRSVKRLKKNYLDVHNSKRFGG